MIIHATTYLSIVGEDANKNNDVGEIRFATSDAYCSSDYLEKIKGIEVRESTYRLDCKIIKAVNDDANMPLKYVIVKSYIGSIVGFGGFLYCFVFFGPCSNTFYSLETTKELFEKHNGIILEAIDSANIIMRHSDYYKNYDNICSDSYWFNIYDADSDRQLLVGKYNKNKERGL